MAEMIYDSTGRINDFSGMYCDIAMEAYYDIQKTYMEMNQEDLIDYHKNREYIKKKVMVIVVFSAMCIEAFLNDYLAVYLGDDEYYESYDILKPLDKLKLVCQFIFKIDFDKNALYYQYTKQLIKRRNNYVHNKSIDSYDYLKSLMRKNNIPNRPMTDEEYEEYMEHTISQYNDGTLLKNEMHSYHLIMQEAEESLKAIKELATFFDKHDKGINAIRKLFGIYDCSIDEDRELLFKEPALKMLNIKRKKK